MKELDGRIATNSHTESMAYLHNRTINVSGGAAFEVSQRLWISLLWQYPGARETDYVRLERLASEFGLRHRLVSLPPSSKRIYYPSTVPDWLEQGFAIHIISDQYRFRVLDLAVSCEDDKEKSSTVPGGLLVRVLRAIESLWDRMRRSDRRHLRAIHALVFQEVTKHPLEHFIRESVKGWGLTRRQLSYLRVEQYRAILLNELSEAVELLGVCGVEPAVSQALLGQLALLRSPLSELIHVTISLMRVAASVPEEHRLESPIDALLCYYQGLRRLYLKAEPNVPKLLLPRLLHYAKLLADLTDESQEKALFIIRRRLEVLQTLNEAATAYGQLTPASLLLQ